MGKLQLIFKNLMLFENIYEIYSDCHSYHIDYICHRIESFPTGLNICALENIPNRLTKHT